MPTPYVMAPDRVTAPQPCMMEEFITKYSDWQRAYATNLVLADCHLPCLPTCNNPHLHPPNLHQGHHQSHHYPLYYVPPTICMSVSSFRRTQSLRNPLLSNLRPTGAPTLTGRIGKSIAAKPKCTMEQRKVPPMVENSIVLPYGLQKHAHR